MRSVVVRNSLLNHVQTPSIRGEVRIPTGHDGYTPQRGVDYWTEEDKQEIIYEVTGEALGLKVVDGKLNAVYEEEAEGL